MLRSIFHGDDAANQAASDAARMHQGDAPSDAPTYTLRNSIGILDLLSETNMVKSRSEGRRLIQQGGIRLNGDAIEDVDYSVEPAGQEQTLQVGKRRFIRLLNS